jgi:Helicase conserved C-terminal domain
MPTPAELRASLEHLVLADILGPSHEHEQLPIAGPNGISRVSDHYLVGMLAPRNLPLPTVEENEPMESAVNDDDPPEDTGVFSAGSMFPSAMGVTFCLAKDAAACTVDARWGRYRKDDTGAFDENEKPIRAWCRTPMGGFVTIALADGPIDPIVPDTEQPGVVVRGTAKRVSNVWLVSLFLVNEQHETAQNRDEAWVFQPQLSVTPPDGTCFVGRPRLLDGREDKPQEAEARSLDMLYRNTVEFAVGHGAGVHVQTSVADPTVALRITTAVVPSFEVPKTDAPPLGSLPGTEGLVLDMSDLASLSANDLSPALRPLADGYRLWLDAQELRIIDPAVRLGSYEDDARDAIFQARAALARLHAAIDLLQSDPVAREAFSFANRAMWQQRLHSSAADARRQDAEVDFAAALAAADVPRNRSWRPFQLAFMLINLPSLTTPTHTERTGDSALVDLLFFPTGGGKTEAYLGLTAYTLAIRRLQGKLGGVDGGDGVAVLMRYTLRLLTSQQFQRAAALICACERIRADAAAQGDNRWGPVPFRIGMWVGGGVTPNYTKDAVISIETSKKTAGRRSGSAASPLQVRSCPWCGSKINPARHLASDAERRRTLVYCGDDLGICEFSEAKAPGEGIPLVTVDEELYRLLPSLVIATADKFAQLPWKGAVQNLFGRVTDKCERHGWRNPDEDRRAEEADKHLRRGDLPSAVTVHGAGPLRPPDLIIQDELHLISGALGTLVGLYETAIDELCTWELDGTLIRPKVVASTATVRRAAEQAFQLFHRRLAVFPPPVLDIEDSFFARQVIDSPGRRYLGICARGVRLKAVEIRMFVALLAAAQKLFDEHGQVADPYMTLVGYFSSVRELAGMRRLVDDDVAARLKRADRRGLAKRRRPIVLELTSRAGSDEIPRALEQLGVKHTAEKPEGEWPVDVLLATNMISVGVDVQRLGLMLVAGQPKATAEYIQATSRVGRDESGPGLVFTVYNWARPRDLSHYETFEHYHATFYRHVEGLSVTPFAPRALDRGLAAVLVALVRQAGSSANANSAAQRVNTSDERVMRVKARIVNRAGELAGDVSDVATKVQHLLDEWAVRQRVAVQRGQTLGYKQEKDGTSIPLILQPNGLQWTEWTCPNSLRETEPNINLLLEREDPSLDAPPDYVFAHGSTDVDVDPATEDVAEVPT